MKTSISDKQTNILLVLYKYESLTILLSWSLNTLMYNILNRIFVVIEKGIPSGHSIINLLNGHMLKPTESDVWCLVMLILS